MTDMNPDQVLQIVRRLHQSTPHGLTWAQSDAEPDEYFTSTARFRYFIRSRDADGRAPYIFELYAPGVRGEGPELTVDSGEPHLRTDLQSLYHAAKRSATGFGPDMAADVLEDIDQTLPF